MKICYARKILHKNKTKMVLSPLHIEIKKGGNQMLDSPLEVSILNDENFISDLLPFEL